MAINLVSTQLKCKLTNLTQQIGKHKITPNDFFENLFNIRDSVQKELMNIRRSLEECEQKVQKYEEECQFVENETIDLAKYTNDELEDTKINHNVAFRKLALYLQKNNLNDEKDLQENLKKEIHKIHQQKEELSNILSCIDANILILVE